MDRLTSLQVFHEIVEQGSFARAARRLEMSSAMASKHLARLEGSLGVRLLNRSNRHLSLTEAGRLYHTQSREALELLDAAGAALGARSRAPSGVLRVTAPVWLANDAFAGVVAEFRQRFPEVLLDLTLENRTLDMVDGGFDLALRATQAPAPALIVRPLCEMPFLLVGAPAYLDRHGRPARLSDIVSHEVVMPTYVDLDGALSRRTSSAVRLQHRAALRCNDSTFILQSARAGLGLAYLPAALLDADLRSGRLEALLGGRPAFSQTLYAAYASRRFMSAALRALIDHLTVRLAPTTAGVSPADQGP